MSLRLLKKESSSELLIVLGSSDKQWSVLEKVHVRNQQNGLVAFELTENIDRFVNECFPFVKCFIQIDDRIS